jgi:PEP-CTERM motif
MTPLYLLTASALAFAALSAPAHAGRGAPAPAVSCAQSFATVANAGYIACQGPLAGNIAAGQVSSVSFAGFGNFELAGTTDDGSAAFAGNPGNVGSGTLQLGSPQTGLFVIGLKGGPTYSLYLFDGAAAGPAGIGALTFDTLGITKGNGSAGPGLSHAALFMAPVPEPGTWALMAAGLALVGGLAQRRRA